MRIPSDSNTHRRQMPIPTLLLSAALLCAACFPGTLRAAYGDNHDQATSAPVSPANTLDELCDKLGDDDYLVREHATQELFGLGVDIIPRLRARLAVETDPEIQHRIRYLIDNTAPPRQAVIVIRATPDVDLEPGTVITHAGTQRVRSQSELRQQLAVPARRLMLRVRDPGGPRMVGPVDMSQLIELSDFVSPHGMNLSEAVRLYAEGFVEQAYEILRDLPQPIPENELSRPLQARIAYTAGDGTYALSLMADRADSIRATGEDWTSPSFFDLRGPGKAPFHMEWVLAGEADPEAYTSQNDPDLRIQRILLPARRYADALVSTAGYWQRLFRDKLGSDRGTTHIAGNQLAVVAWMFHGLDLQSECCRLIEPRSVILRVPNPNLHKWVRVETDAWLPFLAGDAKKALDGFYRDAFEILQRPPQPGERRALIRNPGVAARLAFFLYQFPDDERVARALAAVNRHGHPALPDYLYWTLYALRAGNRVTIHRDLLAALPNVSEPDVARYAWATALLEYVQRRPDADVFRTARQRVLGATRVERTQVTLAMIDALLHLSEHQPNDARRALLPFRHEARTSALWHTAEFLANPPPAALNHSPLTDALLVIPAGTGGHTWLVLGRDRRLMRFDSETNLLTAVRPATPTWFPNPLTWPWIGREDASGRVWVYCRRRIVEIAFTDRNAALRLNLRTTEIPAFDRYVGPHFGRFADAVASLQPAAGENSEFLKADLRSGTEYFADPDLREIGAIEPLPRNPQIVHVALRGGPHLLIDTNTGRSWTSIWMEKQLELTEPLTFFARIIEDPDSADTPRIALMSNQGLIRFDLGAESLVRVPLPGNRPFPAIVPESTPYERHDQRWVYFARLPEDGGAVFRLSVFSGDVKPVDMINEALPAHFFDLQPRADLRAMLDKRLAEAGLPTAQRLVADVSDVVTRWRQKQKLQQKQPP